jgi:hypothetical protein
MTEILEDEIISNREHRPEPPHTRVVYNMAFMMITLAQVEPDESVEVLAIMVLLTHLARTADPVKVVKVDPEARVQDHRELVNHAMNKRRDSSSLKTTST